MTTGFEPFAGFDKVGGGPDGPARQPERAADLRTWVRDLALGARFAAGGGREGWTRTVLTAVGVGLAVAMLLLAAAVPPMMAVRDHKGGARAADPMSYIAEPSARTLLVSDADTTYHGKDITGLVVHPEGPKAERPPGLARFPGPGQMMVSPALKRLLASTPLLRPRFPYTVTGTIGDAGLLGPAELYYYAGSDHLVSRDRNYANGNADRVSGFGRATESSVRGPVFDLLLVVMLVVLLLPVGVFVGTAVRLGGERRDRRLAALRLVGADIRMTRRIAAGEALLGAVCGLALGGVFFLAGRQLASHYSIRDISAFPADLTPSTPLTVLIVLAVPVAAVAVTLASLRGTVIEPLGVVRRGLGRRRRLWWRLLLPVLGLALLAPLFGKVRGDASLNEYQVAAGALLLLFGVTTVLPWVVEAVVGRLHGGPVPWQLAVRRLQLNSSASARMVSGVTVAVAGAIALQMLFAAVSGDFVQDTGADLRRAQAAVDTDTGSVGQLAAQVKAVSATPGVDRTYGYLSTHATRPDASRTRGGTTQLPYLPVEVADCATLRQMARITACGPGSVFLVAPTLDDYVDGDDDRGYGTYVKPGRALDFNAFEDEAYTGTPHLWRIPAGARTTTSRDDPEGVRNWGVLATPQALGSVPLKSASSQVMVNLDAKRPDAIEYLRNTGARLGIGVQVVTLRATVAQTGYTKLRRGLFVGATLTMGLIGASLLVTMLEQLRERKKLLAVLVAFGTRRSALAWSVLWQTTVPVVLGLLLACLGGLGLGAALLAMVGRTFRMDWIGMAQMSGIGAGVIFAVTLLSLPPLWRLMRADGLRTE